MLSVLYEDSDILVAVKPAGVESQSARGFAKDMVSEIRRYLTIQARNPQNIHKLTTLSSKGQWYVENLWIIMVYMWIISDRIRERTGLKLWINRQQEVNGQSFHIRQRHRQSAVTRGRAGNTVW